MTVHPRLRLSTVPLAALALLLWAALLPAAHAQSRAIRPMEDDFASKKTDDSDAPDLKTPSMWLRPSQTTPAAQWALAQAREEQGNVKGARRTYDALVHRWHTAPEAVGAQLAVARLREKAGQLLRAFTEYQYAVEHFSGQFTYSQVVERQFAIANKLRTDLGRGFFGFGRQADADQVVSLFRRIARNAPSWERTPECYLMMGLTYESDQSYEEAVSPYETLAVRFPGHPLVESAMFRVAQCRYRLATDNPRDERTLRNALSALAAARRDYPSHPELAQITAWTDELRARLTRMNFERAAFYDRLRKDPAAATLAYTEFLRMFPNAAEADAARARIAALAPLAKKPKAPSSTPPEDTP